MNAFLAQYARFFTADSSLRDVLAAKIPAEQERVKNFRKQHGATKMGETTIDMVSININHLIETRYNNNKE